jgi:Pullulanase N2 domain
MRSHPHARILVSAIWLQSRDDDPHIRARGAVTSESVPDCTPHLACKRCCIWRLVAKQPSRCRITPELIAWDAAADAPPGATFQLLHSRAAGLRVEDESATGADDIIQLQLEPAGLPRAARLKFPHLASLPALRLPPEAAKAAPHLLQGQLAAVVSPDGSLAKATGTRHFSCFCACRQALASCMATR